ncbi:hypothetical protein Tco_0945943 [Tanacetum coccineum]
MPHPSQYSKLSKTSTEEMMREWMASQIEAGEDMKNKVILEKKIQCTKPLPHTIKPKSKQKVVEGIFKSPSIRNENDKGDVKFIEEDAIKPIPTMPNPNLITSSSPTVPPFLKDCTAHISHAQSLTKEKMFEHDVLLNHVGGKELKSIDGVGNGVLTKKEIKKVDMGLPKEPNKEWKLNKKMVPHNEHVYYYLWHSTEIPHLNCIIKET